MTQKHQNWFLGVVIVLLIVVTGIHYQKYRKGEKSIFDKFLNPVTVLVEEPITVASFSHEELQKDPRFSKAVNTAKQKGILEGLSSFDPSKAKDNILLQEYVAKKVKEEKERVGKILKEKLEVLGRQVSQLQEGLSEGQAHENSLLLENSRLKLELASEHFVRKVFSKNSPLTQQDRQQISKMIEGNASMAYYFCFYLYPFLTADIFPVSNISYTKESGTVSFNLSDFNQGGNTQYNSWEMKQVVEGALNSLELQPAPTGRFSITLPSQGVDMTQENVSEGMKLTFRWNTEHGLAKTSFQGMENVILPFDGSLTLICSSYQEEIQEGVTKYVFQDFYFLVENKTKANKALISNPLFLYLYKKAEFTKGGKS